MGWVGNVYSLENRLGSGWSEEEWGVVGEGGGGEMGGGLGGQKVSLREMDSKKAFVQSSPLRPYDI